MEQIKKEIEVEAPLRVVYNQWTQFEEFPKFMEGVQEVRQLDAKRLFWRAEILGKDVEWESLIYEQIPDQRIAWRSTSGHPNSGAVYFTVIHPDKTRVALSLEYQPLGATEKVADALGVLSSRVEGDLKRFKKFIEKRGTETGGWRGEIQGGVRTSAIK